MSLLATAIATFIEPLAGLFVGYHTYAEMCEEDKYKPQPQYSCKNFWGPGKGGYTKKNRGVSYPTQES